jgi:hypothetical protein
MDFKKFTDALKNADKITAGVINSIFKRDDVELIAADRLSICQDCESLDIQGDKCLAPGTQPCCSECGCSLGFKTRSLSSECPLGKWKALLTEEQEDKLDNID